MVDLCAGTGGWQAPFEDHGWRTVGLDVRDMSGVDVVADVRRLPLNCTPRAVTCSPPCDEFSTAWNRWVPLGDRDPDLSVWEGCLEAVDSLDPDWWILENVGGAQHWFGPADKVCYPWFLWGEFPPFDAPDLRSKGATWNQDPAETARIPYRLADAFRRSVEVWT